MLLARQRVCYTKACIHKAGIVRCFSSVGHRHSLSLAEFVTEFFEPAKPVVLKGYFSSLPAIKKWPQDDFAVLHKYANVPVPVEISAGTASYSNAPEKFEQAELPLSQFLAFLTHARQAVEQGIPLGDVKVYLAQHALFDSIPELYPDCTLPSFVETSGKQSPTFCSAGRKDLYNINIWLGYATHTPLHQDPYSNIFAQLFGTKQCILFPPSMRDQLDMHRDPLLKNTSKIADIFKQEAQAELEECVREAGLQCQLETGDGLFIPEGYLHSFKGSAGLSGSVNWWFR